MSQAISHRALQPEYRLLVFLVSIGFFMQALDTTIVNTAIPAMAKHLHEDPLNTENFDIPAFTVTMLALISTMLAVKLKRPLVLKVIPAASKRTELPLLSIISTLPGPSLSVTFWPPGVSRIQVLLAVLVVERDLHAVAAADDFLVVVAGAVHRLGGRVAAVPQAAEHVGPTRVAASSDRTSSSTSGVNQLPRLLPPISVASRAHSSQAAPCASGDHGRLIFWRPVRPGP